MMEFANSGADALARIASTIEQSLILILSDINMPGMTGLEMLPKVKEMRPTVPIIMITAYGDPETRRKALESGATGLLTKPIDFDAMKQAATSGGCSSSACGSSMKPDDTVNPAASITTCAFFASTLFWSIGGAAYLFPILLGLMGVRCFTQSDLSIRLRNAGASLAATLAVAVPTPALHGMPAGRSVSSQSRSCWVDSTSSRL